METIMTKRFILDEANPRTYNRQGLNQNNAAGNVKYNKDKQTTEAMPDAKPSGENKLSVGELFSLAKTVSDQLTQIIDYNKHGEDTIKNLNDAYKSVTDGVKQGLEAEDGRKGTAAFNSAVIDFIKQTKQIILSLRYTDNDDKSAGDNLIKILNELQDNVTPIDHVHSEKDVSKIKTSIQSLYNGMTAVVKSQLNKTQDASAIEQAIKYLNGGSMFFSKSFYTTEHLTELAEPIALVSNAVGQIDKVINKPISDGGLGGGINDIYIDLPNYTNLTNVCQDFNDVIASNETTAVTTSQSTAETEVDWQTELNKGTRTFDEYYKTMFGDNATLVSSFGTPFLMTLENFGYTAATNPYIVYIRYMLANNYGLKDRRQFLAVYQAYAGERKDLPQQTKYDLKTNILYNIDLYNQSADNMYNYLLLQRKADDVKIDKNNNSKLFDLWKSDDPNTYPLKLRYLLFNKDTTPLNTVQNPKNIDLRTIKLKPVFKVEAELRQLGISEEQKDTRSTTVSDATLQQFADALGKLNLNAKTACDFIISAYNDMPEIQDELITKYKAATDEGKYVFGSIDEATLTNCKKLFSKYKLTDARVANTLLDYFAKLIKPAANATDGSKK